MPTDLPLIRRLWRLPFRFARLALLALIGAGLAHAQQPPASPPETNPVVISIEAGPLTTPAQLARAVQVMLDIDRADLALKYLGQLESAVTTDDQWFALARDFGTAFTFRIATLEAVQPLGRQIADKLIAAGNRIAHDPARIDALTRQLTDVNRTVRSSAFADLQMLGAAGAAAILNAIADSKRSADRSGLQRALDAFGPAAEPAISGALRSNDEPMQLAAAQAARGFPSGEVVLQLLRPAFSPEAPPAVRSAAENSLAAILHEQPTLRRAAAMLRAAVYQHLKPEFSPAMHELYDQKMWRLHPDTHQLVELSKPNLVSQRMKAAEYAEDLRRLLPNDTAAKQLYILALLEASKMLYGFELPIQEIPAFDAVRNADESLLNTVLAEAMERDLVGAAMGSCEALAGKIESAQLCGERPATLVRATRYPDVRVQFAACATIMGLQPATAFPGSSEVAKSLVNLAQGQGQSKVLILFPSIGDAQYVAASIEKLGYQTQAVTNARTFLEIASADVDVDMVLISDRMNPSYSEIVEQLRTNPRTSHLPVGILYTTDQVDFSWRSGAYKEDVSLHLVLDTRKFPGYQTWVERNRQKVESRQFPLLLVVNPGDSDFSLGRMASDPGLRFIELEEKAPLITEWLPEQIAELYGLSRTPVALVFEPVGSIPAKVSLTAEVVLKPDDWEDWSLWTRLLHDNPVTNEIDMVLASPGSLRRYESLSKSVEVADPTQMGVDDIAFIFDLLSQTLNTELAHTNTYIDRGLQLQAQRVATEHPLVIAMPRTKDHRLIARQISRLAKLTQNTPVTRAQKNQFAQQAVQWLVQLSASEPVRSFWNVQQYDEPICGIASTATPSSQLCELLGNLATPAAQRQLLEIAGRLQLPIEIRRAAVAAFKRAIEANGILLTTQQILQQYELYNSSSSLPPESLQVLGSVLDVIERR